MRDSYDYQCCIADSDSHLVIVSFNLLLVACQQRSSSFNVNSTVAKDTKEIVNSFNSVFYICSC